MSKFNLSLLGLALLQSVVLLIVVFVGNDKGTTDVKERRFLEIAPSAVYGIEISSPDTKDTPDVSLTRTDSGWAVASADGLPVKAATADFRKDDLDDDQKAIAGDLEKETTVVRDFFKDVLSFKVKRPVLRRTDNHEAVKVAEKKYEKRVTLKSKDGKELAKFYVAAGSDSSTVYVRKDGEKEVFETTKIRAWDLDAGTNKWSDMKYADLKLEDVKLCKIKIADGAKEFTLEKVAEPDPAASQPTSQPDSAPTTQPVKTIDVWYIAGAERMKADKMTVENVIRVATTLYANRILKKSAPDGAGFDQPTATITVTMIDGSEATLTVGKKTGEPADDYFIKHSKSDWYAVVSKWSLDAVLETTLEKLKEKPAGAADPEDHTGHDHK